MVKPMLIGAKITRVSLELQVGNYSADAQDHKFDEIGRQHGVIFPEEFRIDDEGYSGADFNRPSIKKALRWVREGKINCVGWTEVDRFARNVEGGLTTIRQFREAGATVILGRLGPYQDDGWYKNQMYLLMMMSEWQKDQIRAKSMDGVAQKISKGLAHGGRSPMGWRFVTASELNFRLMQAGMPIPPKPANSHEPVAEDQKTVLWMGDLILGGMSLRGVCRELMARGIPPRSKALGFTKGVAKQWNVDTLKKIVLDPCYATGVWHYGKTECVEPKKQRKPEIERHRTKTVHKARPKSQWQEQHLPGGPIMSMERHLAIVAAVERNSEEKLNVGKPAVKNEALLKRLVKCKCGFAVAPKVSGDKTYYGCTNRDRLTGESLCPHFWVKPLSPNSRPNHRAASNPEGTMKRRSILTDVLDTAVWEGWKEALTGKLDALVDEYKTALVADIDQSELDRMRALEPKLISQRALAVRKELEFSEDADMQRVYSEQVAELTGQINLLRKRLAAMEKDNQSIVVDTASIRGDVKLGMTTDKPADRRRILVAWIHGVVWACDEAEITLRIPLKGANCQREEHHVDNYILLKTKVRVAA
jgi:DNA invertase Pin-like site-specific DNA recombinase